MSMEFYQDDRQRDFFIETIRRRMIGPGGDISGYSDEAEILYSNPTSIYHSGILFSPAYSFDGANAMANDADDTDENDEIPGAMDIPMHPEEEGVGADADADSGKGFQSDRLLSHYPTFMGLVFAMGKEAESFRLRVSYARYEPLGHENVGIVVPEDVYQRIEERLMQADLDDRLVTEFGPAFLFGDQPVFRYDNESGLLTLERLPISVNDGTINLQSKVPRRILGSYFNDSPYLKTVLMKKLLSRNIYKRIPRLYEREIRIDDLKDGSLMNLVIDGEGDGDVVCLLQMRGPSSNQTIKAVLRNVSKKGAKSYNDCVFQAKIGIEGKGFVPISDSASLAKDYDFRVLEYQYSDFKRFAKGMGVAAEWKIDPYGSGYASTTHLPEVDIHQFSNGVRPGDSGRDYTKVFKLRNISIWTGLDDPTIIALLKSFVSSYSDWCDAESDMEAPDGGDIREDLLARQRTCVERLMANVDFLEETPEALTCFKIANAAMLVQMTIAKDARFKKGRDCGDFVEAGGPMNIYNNVGFFQSYGNTAGDLPHSYRPFQLAFLLMNVRNVFYDDKTGREDYADLIWFPTGGGKTEAYLALTALTVVERRRRLIRDGVKESGITAMMRYTLRLLTAQQFERASMLICALEFLRSTLNEDASHSFGDERITIGMWVGSAVSPNRIEDVNEAPFNRMFDILGEEWRPADQKVADAQKNNRFPITYCPWCGCNLLGISEGQVRVGYGYKPAGANRFFEMNCINVRCHYNGRHERTIPVVFIDELIYRKPPTLLFATVDKMVQLSRKRETRTLFSGATPPELVIQDELHLLNGPLGSLTALYETLIRRLCMGEDGRKSMIVASTATTRNTDEQIRRMFHRRLNVFPARGLRFRDNYFSYIEEDARRRHISVCPTGKTTGHAEVRLVECMYEAKMNMLQCHLEDQGIDAGDMQAMVAGSIGPGFKDKIDPYWTLVLYYNTLRDMGRSKSRVQIDYKEQVKGMFNSHDYHKNLLFAVSGMQYHLAEFTGREIGAKIKSQLTKIEKEVSIETYQGNDGNTYLSENKEAIDLALVTNMFSVGIDIDRLNLMVMVGQPPVFAEYIQASSRVGRKRKGLVVNLFNPTRARETSLFEDYTYFHLTYYKNVEPMSITPFTDAAVSKLSNALLSGYSFHVSGIQNVGGYNPNCLQGLLDYLREIGLDAQDMARLEAALRSDSANWIASAGQGIAQIAKNDMYPLTRYVFDMMNSLRDIDEDVYVRNLTLYID
jgi:hypothetical protein